MLNSLSVPYIIDEMIAKKQDQRRVRISWIGFLFRCRHSPGDESPGYTVTPDTRLRRVQSHGEAPHCSRESG